MISRILVPTDGSGTARKAARYAFELAALSGSTITLLSVLDRSIFVGRPYVPASQTPTHIVEPLEDYLRQAAEIDMDEIENTGQEFKVQVRKIIRYGHPVEEIVNEAESSKTDLIVMGSHGRSAISAALLGSVTFGVIYRDTHIPVLVIRK